MSRSKYRPNRHWKHWEKYCFESSTRFARIQGKHAFRSELDVGLREFEDTYRAGRLDYVSRALLHNIDAALDRRRLTGPTKRQRRRRAQRRAQELVRTARWSWNTAKVLGVSDGFVHLTIDMHWPTPGR